MGNSSKYFLVLFSLLSACSSCENKPKPQPVQQQQQEVYHKKAPEFNADSAYAYVKAQVDFGPRTPNTKQHDACAAYLYNKLKGFLPNTFIQKGVVTSYNNV